MPWFDSRTSELDPVSQQQINLRQGDRLSTFMAIVTDEYGEPLSLVGARGWMTLRPLSPTLAEPMVDQVEVTIEDAAAGAVSYDWQLDQTLDSDPGAYDVVIEFEFDDGRTIVVPSSSEQFIVNLRSGLASDFFIIGVDGALVPDGLGGFVRYSPLLNEDGTLRLTEDGTALLFED